MSKGGGDDMRGARVSTGWNGMRQAEKRAEQKGNAARIARVRVCVRA